MNHSPLVFLLLFLILILFAPQQKEPYFSPAHVKVEAGTFVVPYKKMKKGHGPVVMRQHFKKQMTPIPFVKLQALAKEGVYAVTLRNLSSTSFDVVVTRIDKLSEQNLHTFGVGWTTPVQIQYLALSPPRDSILNL